MNNMGKRVTLFEKIVTITLIILALYGIFSIAIQGGAYIRGKLQSFKSTLMIKGFVKVPDVRLTDLNGNETSLYEIIGGRALLLFIGSMTCPSCQNEINELENDKDNLIKNLKGVSIAFAVSDSIDDARNYLVSQKISFPTYYTISHEDENRLAVSYIPTVYLIGKDKKLLWYKIGFYKNTFTEITDFVNKNLNSQKKGGE
jgi:thioredoxin-related protein